MINDLLVNTIATVLGGAVITYLHIYLERRDRERGRKQLVKDIRKRIYRPTPIVFIYALAMMQVAWNVITLALIPISKSTHLGEVSFAEIPLAVIVILLLTGIIMVPISVYMHHRLPKSRLGLNVSLVVTTYVLAITEAALISGSFPSLEDASSILFALALAAGVLLPAIYLGVYWAKKTEQQFTITQLFKQLPVQDKKDLIDLVDSLPSLKK